MTKGRPRPFNNSIRFSGLGRILIGGALALVLIAAGCSDDDSDATNGDGSGHDEAKGSSAAGDLITSAEVRPGPNSVLSAELDLEMASDSTIEVTVDGPGDTAVADSPDGETTTATVPVLGMRATETYDIEVTATSTDGETESLDLTFDTGAIPEDFPPLEVTVSEPDAMSPGITLYNAMYWGPPDDSDVEVEDPENAGLIIAVDSSGETVWYYQSELGLSDVSTTDRGTLLISVDDVLIREIDMLGSVIKEQGTLVATEYSPVDIEGTTLLSDITDPIDIDSSHHELYEMANGNTLTLSTEIIDLDPTRTAGLCDGKTNDDDEPIPDPEAVVGDVVTELTPAGEVVQEWAISDYFAPLDRPGTDMCTEPNPIAPPNWFYPQREDLRDWTHANAAVVDEATNTLVVSLRHLNSLMGIRYADDENGPAGELLWDIAPDGSLAMVGGGEVAYHGHAVEPQPDGTLLYYDNGNGRPGTGPEAGAPPFSRAVMFRVDPDAATVEQVWEHRDVLPDGSPIFAAFLSDADRLENGDILITHGGVSTEAELNYSRLVEVVPNFETGENEIVFDAILGDQETIGWTAYRAERLPSLVFGQ